MKIVRVRSQTVWLVSLMTVGIANAQRHAIDAQKSVATVRVYKAGLLSALGHDHMIAAPISSGAVDTDEHTVAVNVNAGELKVLDQGISDKDRAEIQATMLGPEVLDVQHNPRIFFRSTSVRAVSANSWAVQGDLTLRGETRIVKVAVRENGGHYVGTARFKQTDFGMKPVKVAGGTIRVKDEIQIDFDIQLAR